jgi:enterobactin synthetase component D
VDLGSLPHDLRDAVPKRQAEFLAGRSCARIALTICAPEHACFDVRRSPDRAPIWPHGVVGSITHTGDYAAAAVARASKIQAIGLDSEEWMHPQTSAEVGKTIASADEVRLTAEALRLDTHCALTLLFSVKESLFKSVYPFSRRYFDFLAVAAISVDAVPRTCMLRLAIDLTPELRAGTLFEGRFVLDEQRVHTGVAVAARVP